MKSPETAVKSGVAGKSRAEKNGLDWARFVPQGAALDADCHSGGAAGRRKKRKALESLEGLAFRLDFLRESLRLNADS